MKKHVATLLIGILIGAIAFSGVTLAASQKQATLSYNDIKITLNGQAVVPKDSSGNIVEPFIIDGTTYLPVRGIASALGLEVDWDQSTQTVKLQGSLGSTMPASPFTLGAGQYIVGEDIPSGKYDCKAIAGSGNFMGSIASLGYMGLNEILAEAGSALYGSDRVEYSNLRLADGDVFTIGGDLKIEFTAN